MVNICNKGLIIFFLIDKFTFLHSQKKIDVLTPTADSSNSLKQKRNKKKGMQ